MKGDRLNMTKKIRRSAAILIMLANLLLASLIVENSYSADGAGTSMKDTEQLTIVVVNSIE